MFFPFEIGLILTEQAKKDDTLEKVENIECPHGFSLYLEKKIMETLPEPTIIDFQLLKEIELLFIPPILKPMNQYRFYDIAEDSVSHFR